MLSQYIFDVPRDYADQYLDGKYLVSGGGLVSGAGAASWGPSMFAFAPYQQLDANCEPTKVNKDLKVFNGSIDDVLIYNKSLTAQEVLDKFVITIGDHGNNSTASQGPGLIEILNGPHPVKEGDHILMVGYGAGFTWAMNHYII